MALAESDRGRSGSGRALREAGVCDAALTADQAPRGAQRLLRAQREEDLSRLSELLSGVEETSLNVS